MFYRYTNRGTGEKVLAIHLNSVVDTAHGEMRAIKENGGWYKGGIIELVAGDIVTDAMKPHKEVIKVFKSFIV